MPTLINEVIALAKQQAKGRPPRLRVSKDVEALLRSIGEAPELPATAASATVHEDAQSSIAASTPEPDRKEDDSTTALPKPASRSAEEEMTCIADEVALCAKCALGGERNRPVPGEGNLHADLVFVGEAPGAEEDKTGRPFVGRAGQLLTDIIVKGMHLRREDVFICNVLKCRPPNNRTPNPEEVMQCEPYLWRQLDAIQPKVICALGATAAQTLLKTDTPIRELRGVWHNYHGIPFRVTYHPAYLLRKPSEKRKTWEDVQEIMRVLNGEVVPEI